MLCVIYFALPFLVGDTWEVDLDSLENEDSLKYSLRRVKQLSLGDVDLVFSGTSSGYDTVTYLYLGYSVASIMYNGAPAIVSSMPRTISTADLRVNDKVRNMVLSFSFRMLQNMTDYGFFLSLIMLYTISCYTVR